MRTIHDVGEAVHFVDREARHLAAIITEVLPRGLVCLTIFDSRAEGAYSRQGIRHSHTPEPMTWHERGNDCARG